LSEGPGARVASTLYSLAAHLLRAAAWPTLWWLGRRTPAFRERWRERRARAPWPAGAAGGIVVHAASMGEVAAATPLVEALRAARPDLPLTVTCTTPTASALIRERFGQRVHHCYLPFDTPGAVRRFLAQAAPRLLVAMETELWPNLLRLAQARGTAVALAGGRLSERSARRYARWPLITGPLLGALDLLLVQDDAARARFLALGAAPLRVQVAGSPKFDTPLPTGTDALRAHFQALTAGRRVWVAASTHDGEEVALLAALAELRVRWPQLLLVLVPRHPQRFDEVAALVDRSGLPWQRRSALGDAGCAGDTAVLLGDTMGELLAWYGAAEFAFIGGTLVERGGHSPLEAAGFATPMVSGPHVFNFAQAFAALHAADAVRGVADARGLEAAADALLADPAGARALGQRAAVWAQAQRGGAARSVAALLDLLDRRAPHIERCAGRLCWRADAELAADAGPAQLAPAGWPSSEPVAGSGRGSAWFVQDGARAGVSQVNTGARAGVLRHYRRGGALGRWLGDRYLRGRAAHSRALAEFALLQRLRGWGVAVPRPWLAGVRTSGFVERNDIVVERIAGAQDLAQRLRQAPLAADTWARVGGAIARMHAAGVDHRDLNCRNLLLDADDAVWIVDFDACRVRPIGPWVQANLARLLRSLRKEAGRAATWHWDEARDGPALTAAHTRSLAALS
jgi:3-deoxy-D-manno-octulosonic-acid transferase